MAEKIKKMDAVRKKKAMLENQKDAEGETEKIAGNINQKVKYGIHCTLVITERIIGTLMDAYKNIFVVTEKTDAMFYNDQGFAYFDKGNYEKAIESFLKYVEKVDAQDVDVLFYLGMAYAHMNKHDEAIDYLKKAEQLDGNDPDIISELSSCLVKAEKYEEAIGYLKKAIEIKPEISNNYFLLGTAYEKAGNSEEAIDMYRKSIELNPRDPLLYHALGFMYESTGKHRDAMACFKKAMEVEKNR